MPTRRGVAFGAVFALVLTAATLVGIEALASFFVPSWPARELRWTAPINPVSAANEPFASRPWMADPFNSWGMRDRERSVTKDPPYRARAVLVGDSFVEASFTRRSLPAAVEADLSGVEAVNLGISDTDPQGYFYRLRDVALKLSPDVALLFIYMGNDFVPAERAYGASTIPPLIGDSEGGSLLGAVMPRTRWLLRNRWPSIEAMWQQRPPADEVARLYRMAHQPRNDALAQLSDYMKAYYKPELPLPRIAEVLSRGEDRFWRGLEAQPGDPEFLLGFPLDNILVWETGTFPVPAGPADAPAVTPASMIDATASWIVAMEHLAAERSVRVKTFIIPVGSIDADYAEFWKPWPRAYAWNYICDAREESLVLALAKAGISPVRLREDLADERGTYRKRDGHWTEKGEAIVARRVAQEIKKLGF
jgi:hypothetical protein